jgi:hypothetical protein
MWGKSGNWNQCGVEKVGPTRNGEEENMKMKKWFGKSPCDKQNKQSMIFPNR